MTLEYILDVGCGTSPWFLWQSTFDKYPKYASADSRRYREVRPDMLYFGLDIHPFFLGEVRKTTQTIYRDYVNGKLFFVQADGLHLPFSDGIFDLVVSNNVISLPRDYCEYVFKGKSEEEQIIIPGMTDEQKIHLLLESIRVLKPGGRLIVSATMTPEHAFGPDRLLKKYEGVRHLETRNRKMHTIYKGVKINVNAFESVYLKS